jgi:hypothetical protein
MEWRRSAPSRALGIAAAPPGAERRSCCAEPDAAAGRSMAMDERLHVFRRKRFSPGDGQGRFTGNHPPRYSEGAS